MDLLIVYRVGIKKIYNIFINFLTISWMVRTLKHSLIVHSYTVSAGGVVNTKQSITHTTIFFVVAK